MRIISEKTGKEYKTVAECEAAEKAYDEKVAAEKAKKEALAATRKARAAEVEKAYDAVKAACTAPSVKAVLDVELNEGQMLQDVKLALNGAVPVDFFGHLGSEMPTVDEVKAKIKSMKEGK